MPTANKGSILSANALENELLLFQTLLIDNLKSQACLLQSLNMLLDFYRVLKVWKNMKHLNPNMVEILNMKVVVF